MNVKAEPIQSLLVAGVMLLVGGCQESSAPEVVQLPTVVEEKTVNRSSQNEGRWPMFRGNTLSTGVADSDLPKDLALDWTFDVIDGAFEATAAIVDGTVYIGDSYGKLYALRLMDGKRIWEYKVETGFVASALPVSSATSVEECVTACFY